MCVNKVHAPRADVRPAARCYLCRVACEEEVLAGHLHAGASPGRAGEAAKQAAGKLLDRLKCPAFSPLDLHNGFPNAVGVGSLPAHTVT